ncbi:MAG: cytochrome ubiquinol oxidase subunit I [Holophaga sp.]|nr:cytochrome ubiquinol oxidase subunit I [Holophaga sp.]
MGDPLFWHRMQFGFTASFHYLFPQLTMGLALLIAVMKWLGLDPGREHYNEAARFWIRILGINFAVGVVTGIPLEFQFGTNWSRFSAFSGGVIGQTLGMEGMFAFFLESTFLGILIWGEKRFGPRRHFWAAIALFVGSWLSGYFIVATDAFMQHPVGHMTAADGTLQLASFWDFVINPWATIQYLHNMAGAVVTGSFVIAAVGAYWTLRGIHTKQAWLNLKIGVTAGLLSSLVVAFPTGDLQGKLVAKHQPVSLAAMEGRFESGPRAGLNMIGQPNVAEGKLDNPIRLPGVLSFIAYGSFSANVKGLNEFPRDQWPTSIEMLYYGFHIMVGLGTLFIGLMGMSFLLLWKRRIQAQRWMLWILMLAFPFPYIANTMGWMTAEMGRQPWLIFGVMRTSEGSSHLVHSGQTIFTMLGFAGLYFILGVLFLFLIGREIAQGPAGHGEVN